MTRGAPPLDVALVGRGGLLVACADALLARGHRIVAVATECPGTLEWASEAGLAALPVSDGLAGELSARSPDLIFAIGHLAKLPSAVLETAGRAAINFHDGPLPRYAGLNAPAWALWHGETAHGIAWHLMDDRIDTGPILSARAVPIGPDDTAFSLCLACHEAGIAAFAEVLDLVDAGDLTGTPQDHGERSAFVRTDRPPAAGVIDWRQPAAVLERRCRALDFGPRNNPLARAKILLPGGDTLMPGAVRIIRDGTAGDAPAGTVLAIGDDEIVVAAGSGTALACRDLATPLSPGVILRGTALRDVVGPAGTRLAPPAAERIDPLQARAARAEAGWVARLAGLEPVRLPAADASTANGQFPLTAGMTTRAVLEALAAVLAPAGTATAAVGLQSERLAATLAGHHGVFEPYPLVRLDAGAMAGFAADGEAFTHTLDLPARDTALPARDALSVVVRIGEIDAPPVASGGVLPGLALTVRADRIEWHASGAADPGAVAKLLAMLRQRLGPPDALSVLREAADKVVPGAGGLAADAPFLANGFDSIRLTRLALAAGARLGRDLTATFFYRHPSLSAAAAALAPTAPALPLSGTQSLVLAAERLAPGGNAFALPFAFRVAADPERLLDATRTVLHRHAALASVIASDVDGEPVQTRGPAPTVERIRAPGDQGALASAAARPFDLAAGPLCRAFVFDPPAGEAEPVLLLVAHHLVFDGISQQVVVEEIAHALAGAAPPTAAAPFADMIAHERALLAGEEGARGRAYWQKALDGLAAPELPADRPAAAPPDRTGAVHAASLDAAHTAGLDAFAAREGVGTTAVLLAAFAAILSEATGRSDLAIGVPLAGRPEPRFDRTVGAFANPVPIRLAPTPDTSFADLARAVQEALSAAMVHGAIPLGEIIAATGGRAPFEAALYVQNYFALPGGMRRLPAIRQTGELPLALEVEPAADGLALLWRYQTARFDPATVASLAEAFARRLAAELAGATTPAQAATGFAALAAAPYPRDRTVHGLILETCRRQPDRVAVRFGDRSLTFAALDAASAALAARLVAAGARPGTRVALLLDRSELLPVAFLAVMRTGAAYVPLDPRHPAERLGHIVADCSPAVVLTDAPSLAAAIAPDAAVVDAATNGPAEPPLPADAPEDPAGLAYVIYTSGSTGRPKGVEVGHRALTNLIWSMAHRAPGFPASDRLLAITTPAFDIAALELLLPLVVGGEVVVAASEDVRDGIRLARLIASSGATVLQATPTTWQMLLAAEWGGAANLRAFCGGEALPGPLAEALLARCAEVWNLYGPTETTIWSAVARVRPGEPVTLGDPVANTALVVIDAAGAPAGPGVEGELAIAGDGLAHGYHGRPDLTAERFVATPAASGGRLYRTGDAAIRDADGRLIFRGRLDTQVKLNGHRIELGEVEAALARLPWVARAAAVVRPDAGGSPQLVGFAVARRDAARGTPAADRSTLAAILPEAMRPARIVTLEALPETPNRKLDRRRLAEMDLPAEPAAAAPAARPAPAVEAAVRTAVAELAGVPESAIDADRPLGDFGLGSLAFTRLAARLNARLGLAVDATLFYAAPSLAALVRRLAPAPATPLSHEAAIVTHPEAPDTVAIIGAAARLPGAGEDLGRYFAAILAGADGAAPLPAARFGDLSGGDPRLRHGHLLADVEGFDAAFFAISPREAEAMDPAQRLLLELAWRALEDAALPPARLAGSDTGVFIGATGSDYVDRKRLAGEAASGHTLSGQAATMLANRLSFQFDLAGPSVLVDTACSASLVAIHRAARAVLSGDCTLALAGGVNLLLSPSTFAPLAENGMLSPDGRCRSFARGGEGYGRGEGAGVLVLKRLSAALADGDPIRAVIRGSAENHGGRSQSVTAPNGAAQETLLAAAWRAADVAPDTIGLLEAHGTGTALGDPIEVNALKAALAEARPGSVVLASAKASVGHLEAAAGVAGVLAAVMALATRTLPPLPEAAADPNPRLGLAGSPLRILAAPEPWPAAEGHPRRAGVSSFGFGGSNAHVVLEEAPAVAAATPSGPLVFPLSARGSERLAATAARLLAHLKDDQGGDAQPDLAAVAHTLQTGRQPFADRLGIVARDRAALVAALDAAAQGRDAPGLWRGHAGDAVPSATPAADATPESLAAAWVAGATIDWASLWPDPPRRIALPGVALLPRRFPLPRLAPTEPADMLRPRPLPADGATLRFAVTLAPDAAVLSDHRIDDRLVLPAVVGISLLREAAALARPGAAPGSLRALSWQRPISLAPNDPARDIELRLAPDGAGFTAEIRDGGAVHLTARIIAAAALPRADADVAAIRARCTGAAYDRAACDKIFAARGFTYGATFRALTAVAASPDGAEALATIAPPASDDPLSPAALEAALQAALGVLGDRPEDAYVPYALGAVTSYAPVAGARFAHVRRATADGESADGLPRLAITLLGAGGTVLAELTDYAVRRTRPEPTRRVLFAPRWTAAPLPAAILPRVILLAASDCPLETPPGAIRVTAFPETIDAPVVNALPLSLPPGAPFAQARAASLDPALALARRGAPFRLLTLHAGDAAAAALAAFGAALEEEGGGRHLSAVRIDDPRRPGLAARLGAELATDGAADVAWLADGTRAVRRFAAIPGEPASPLDLTGPVIVTGGTGGLGGILARAIARPGARIVLSGRRPRDRAIDDLVAALRASDAEALYHAGDLAAPGAAEALVAAARAAFGPVRTIVHAAGVLDDRRFADLPAASFEAVLAPKIAATEALDAATADDPPDLFVAFTSLSGVHGVAGQTAYAFANAWLDGSIEARAARRPGRSLAIAWPLWAEGGMAGSEAMVRMMAATFGIAPMSTEGGLALLSAAIGRSEPRLVALEGPSPRLGRRLAAEPAPAPDAPRSRPTVDAAMAALITKVEEVLRLDPGSVTPQDPLVELGVDSIVNIELATFLNARFGLEVTPVLFFEHRTLAEVMDALVARHPAAFAASAPVAENAPPVAPAVIARPDEPAATPGDAVAIVGMAARLPGAADLDAFWQNLAAGRDLVTEVPPSRWDWHALAGDPAAEPGRTNSRWGAFLADVDRFDAAFFGISAREARLMDPQHRIALETVWHALEDAAIVPSSLACSRTGVFLGVTNADYGELLRDRTGGGLEFLYDSGTGRAFLANRISHRLDLTGPSEPVDTLCSSSLVALHRAAGAVRSGECDLALAGGVSVIASPRLHVSFASAGMLSPAGRCRAFDHHADGFVRGEGAGIVVLKRLSAALSDGDRIHAVVRGGGVNHGGRTASLTTPNPAAQAALVAEAWTRSGIDPAAAGLIEAHGTGTALGDPIEVEALQRAFADLAARAGSGPERLWLGSVKSNIGHLEAAAGIAGVVKAVLALRHRWIPPSIHIEAPNPHLKLANGPLALAREGAAWLAPVGRDGMALRRAAGVSSFGAGGVNAHIVLEEAPAAEAATPDDGNLRVLPLSARDGERLAEMAARLADHLAADDASLADVAATLQSGREAMAERLAIVAADHAAAVRLLRAAAAGDHAREGVHRGTVRRPRPANGYRAATADALARAFVAGTLDGWPASGGRRVALPLYPFARERHWIDAPAAGPSHHGASLPELRLTADAPLLADHVVAGRVVLPAAASLVALLDAAPAGEGLADVTFLRPVVAGPDGLRATVAIEGSRATLASPDGTTFVEARLAASSPPDALPAAPEQHEVLDAAALYARFDAQRMRYGPSLRVVQRLRVTGDEARADLALPAEATTFADAALLDGALQAIAGLMPAGAAPVMPFAVEAVARHGPLATARQARVRRRTGPGSPRFDIAIAAADGQVVATLRGVSVRPAGEADAQPLGVYVPVWRPAPVSGGGSSPVQRPVIVAAGPGADALAAAMEQLLPAGPPDPDALVVVAGFPDALAPEPFERAAQDLLARLRGLATRPAASLRLVTVAPQGAGPHPAAAGLTALARAAASELPGLSLVCVDIAGDTPDAAARRALDDPGEPGGALVVLRPGGVRLVRRLEPAAAADHAAAAPGLPHGGRYLIAGGAGGLGIELAEWLVTERGARVMLTGRRSAGALPERVRARLASAGGAIVYRTADLLDADALRAAVAEAREVLGGPLTGAIHAAMVLADAGAATMDEATFRAALDPKVRGSLNLVRVLAGEPLDVLVFFSSVQPFAGGAGQANYVAGCAFQDALAARLSGAAQHRVRVVNWGYWGNVGAVATAAHRQLFDARGVGSIEPAEGWAALDALVAGEDVQRVVYRGDRAGRAAIGIAGPAPEGVGFEAAFAALESHARHRVRAALQRLGLPEDGTAVAVGRLAVAPEHRANLLPALLAMLARSGLVALREDTVAALPAAEPGLPDDAALAPAAALLLPCLDAYGDLLAGRLAPAEVLMPDGSTDRLARLYRDHPPSARCNREVADALARHLGGRPTGARLRVLEVGAGTGATTDALLPVLSPHAGRLAFDVTDLYPALVQRAAARFGPGRPWLAARPFDLDRNPDAQGFGGGSYDAIVATNVVHATADLAASVGRLAQLLAPGGCLLLNELTRAQDYDTIVFGLLPGWWTARDRRANGPVVPAARWRELLAGAGLAARPGRRDRRGSRTERVRCAASGRGRRAPGRSRGERTRGGGRGPCRRRAGSGRPGLRNRPRPAVRGIRHRFHLRRRIDPRTQPRAFDPPAHDRPVRSPHRPRARRGRRHRRCQRRGRAGLTRSGRKLAPGRTHPRVCRRRPGHPPRRRNSAARRALPWGRA